MLIFCPRCGFKLPKTQDLDIMKILEIRGDRGIVEVSDVRVWGRGGRNIQYMRDSGSNRRMHN